MLTGSEPYKLRGILSKEPRSLMTRFGPSPERGPGTQPTNSKWSFQFDTSHNIHSKSSFQFVYVTSNKVLSMCSIERKSNVTIREDKSMVRTMTQCFIQCFYWQGSGPILHTLQREFYQYNNIMWPPNERRQSPTSVIPWKLEKSSVLWNFSCPNLSYPYPETSLTLGMPR